MVLLQLVAKIYCSIEPRLKACYNQLKWDLGMQTGDMISWWKYLFTTMSWTDIEKKSTMERWYAWRMEGQNPWFIQGCHGMGRELRRPADSLVDGFPRAHMRQAAICFFRHREWPETKGPGAASLACKLGWMAPLQLQHKCAVVLNCLIQMKDQWSLV